MLSATGLHTHRHMLDRHTNAMRDKLILTAMVALLVGVAIGATATGATAPADRPTETDAATTNTSITNVTVSDDGYTVVADSNAAAFSAKAPNDEVYQYAFAPDAGRNEVSWSLAHSPEADCGYNPDGPTVIRVYDSEYRVLDRVSVNISDRTEVCR